MTTNVELYEALKPTVGQDAARMIAEIFPPTRELATKADVEALGFATREDFANVRGEMREEFAKIREEFAKIRGEMRVESTRTIKWVVGVFVPLFAVTWGTLAVALLKK